MSEQLSFLESYSEPPPKDRLFLAILPDPDTASRIAEVAQRLRSEHGLKGRPLATDRFHVSLYDLGKYRRPPQNIVAWGEKTATAMAVPPFDIAFDYIKSFETRPGNYPLVLLGGDGVAAVMEFHRALGVAMQQSGLGRGVPQAFTPHLTLLYDKEWVPAQQIDRITWTVREFALVRSLVGRSRHIRLARWPLSGQQ